MWLCAGTRQANQTAAGAAAAAAGNLACNGGQPRGLIKTVDPHNSLLQAGTLVGVRLRTMLVP
ncbi:hypothetical protein ABB25_05155 [Stenotrophomonas koreensis]|uniref:Uncharacterized protein n=1 Tax=Stenotrophomonas koreensis TaxID=266128 RepID=A0A0R0C0Y1_9GAMM|nr:hypothetical protein ABB25_05155 [Stenotrophomonas koreensis]